MESLQESSQNQSNSGIQNDSEYNPNVEEFDEEENSEEEYYDDEEMEDDGENQDEEEYSGEDEERKGLGLGMENDDEEFGSPNNEDDLFEEVSLLSLIPIERRRWNG